MITTPQLIEALGEHLLVMTGVPSVAWENKTFDPSDTYLEAALVPAETENDTLAMDDSATVKTGIFLVTVNSPVNSFRTASDELARQISAHFYGGLRLDAGDGNVLINKPSHAVAGFKNSDETKWQQPIRITYQTEE